MFLVYNLSSGIAESKGSSTFSFLRKFHTVFHSGCTSQHSHQQCTKVYLSPQSCQHLLFVALFIMDTLTDVKWYLIVVLIGISLMANNAEYPFICLRVLCMKRTHLKKNDLSLSYHSAYQKILVLSWATASPCD